jgi:pimeloyl-ACP methyl ester carboxylesterase
MNTCASCRNALQWAQMYNDASIRLSSFNLASVYNLSLIKTPCYMISGGQDVLAPPQAMDLTQQKLGGRLVGSHRVADYGHMVGENSYNLHACVALDI